MTLLVSQCSSAASLRRTIAIAATAALALVLAGTTVARATGAPLAPSLSLTPEYSPAGLGQGTMLTATLALGGDEYFGFVAPLAEARLQLPAGTAAHAAGFATCAAATLEALGPARCPANSAAGEGGLVRTAVTFGPERLEENGTVEAFFAPGGGFNFFLAGVSPLSIGGEMVLTGTLVGDTLTLRSPLVATSPGAYISIRSVTLHLGVARAQRGGSVYSLTMPEECPQGGFAWSAEASLDGALVDDNAGSAVGPLRATARTPCPEGSGGQSTVPGTEGVITAPSASQCVSRRDFVIHVQQIKGVIYRRVSVYVNGRRVDVVHGERYRARVDLRGLPKGRYTVRITVLTTTARTIAGTRTYHTCSPRPLPGDRPGL